ncbi:MarR family winged helix-turn-helix transcriptional regulator [Roseibium sp. LAB1]
MPEKNNLNMTEMRDLIVNVRRTFRQLAGMSDRMLEARGLTASLRAILEFLADEGPSPVPKMAGAKSMTRQSVQALVDRLEGLALVASLPNPEHKRSVLISLTDKGASTFREILAEEGALLVKICDGWPDGALGQANSTLRDFQTKLTELGRTDDVANPQYPE